MAESFAFYDLAQSMVAGDRRYATVFEECCICAYRDRVYGLDCVGAGKQFLRVDLASCHSRAP